MEEEYVSMPITNQKSYNEMWEEIWELSTEWKKLKNEMGDFYWKMLKELEQNKW